MDHDQLQEPDPQTVLETHTVSGVDGKCPRCGVLGPCGPRRTAVDRLVRAGRLPRRVPA